MTTKLFAIHLLIIISLVFQVYTQTQSPPSPQDHPSSVLSLQQIWGFGFLAGLGVSLLGFILAIAMVCCKQFASDSCFQIFIKFFFSLAFGALLGDAMIHILPGAYKAQQSDFRVVAAIFMSSILFFLILERVFEACGITHKHWHNNDCHDDHQGAIQHHDHPNRIQNQDVSMANPQNSIKVIPIISTNSILQQTNSHKCKSNHNQKELSPDHQHSHSHEHDEHQHNHQHKCKHHQLNQKQEQKSCIQNLKGKGPAGYMNLLGSLIHNFMDGLALGVAFATGNPKDFIPILVAIVAHEIPREMGDVAILMTNKFNATQTIICNGTVNLLSLAGVLIGVTVNNLHELTKQYILVFVAGNFIFIAADIWRNIFKNRGFIKNFIEFIGISIGIASMYLILLLESQQQNGHQH